MTRKNGTKIEAVTSRRLIGAREREAIAIELRKRGMSYQAISEAMGKQGMPMTKKGVWLAVTRVMQRMAEDLKPDANAVREEEIMRLRAMLTMLWPAVKKGDVKASGVLLKVQERISLLSGVEVAAQKVELSASRENPLRVQIQDMTEDERKQRLRELCSIAGISEVDHEQ